MIDPLKRCWYVMIHHLMDDAQLSDIYIYWVPNKLFLLITKPLLTMINPFNGLWFLNGKLVIVSND